MLKQVQQTDSEKKREREDTLVRQMDIQINVATTKYIKDENIDNTHAWMCAFKDLETWLNMKDTQDSDFGITIKFRCAAHCQLKDAVLDELYRLEDRKSDEMIEKIKKSRKDGWKNFVARIQSTQTLLQVIEDIKEQIGENILLWMGRKRVPEIVKRYFEETIPHPKTETILKYAFKESFGQQNGSVEKAFHYIEP